MKVRNDSDYFYYPSPSLSENLEDVVIFTENATKREIPNGSVFVYGVDRSYEPRILRSDVGCGITAYQVSGLHFDDNSIKDILRAVNEIGIHIGQGNHFLDFTTAHPSAAGADNHMIYLHSDFNNEDIIPTTFNEAAQFQNDAVEKRISYISKLVDLLGVSGSFYNDWTHNSVTQSEDKVVYRKGAIDLTKTNGVGLLALNPVEGLLLYAGDFSDYFNSAQHGVGRIGSKGDLLKQLPKVSEGMARGYVISGIDSNVEENLRQTYNNHNIFARTYATEFSLIGVTSPELVVTTKA